ncbi:unnamed protein product, partial [Gongylonema pulchrum]|uniref:Rap-GAP domain-containing protein n=1 Tax=Gongylonema pulchrum TaxID=637853 RepID=A0A183CWP6_9BILA
MPDSVYTTEECDEFLLSECDTSFTNAFTLDSASCKSSTADKDGNLTEMLAEETYKALETFMKHHRVSDTSTGRTIPLTRLVERCTSHWVINDVVVSVTNFTDNGNAEDSSADVQSKDVSKFDTRRRHQKPVAPARNALDDSCTVVKPEAKKLPISMVVWTQITVRHIFGSHSWYMRSMKDVIGDFGIANDFYGVDEGMSIVKLLAANNKAVQIPSSEKSKTLRSLRNLDRISPLELHTVGVVYIAHGQKTECEILANLYGSARYENFIRLLGEPLSLENCPGGLSIGCCGSFTYAYMDEISKIIFHVATLMPHSDSDPSCNAKKKFIGNDFVSVVFNDSGTDYTLGTISGKFAHVALEVVPQDNEHLLITVHSRQEIALWLAFSRAFLPDKQAAVLVRKLIIRAQLSVN